MYQIASEERRHPSPARAAEDAEHALATFRGYLEQANLRPEDLQGMEVVEMGPGPNQAVALQFLAAGAKRVTCVDKFVPQAFTEYHARVYGKVPGVAADVVDIERRTFNPARLRYVFGTIEDLSDFGTVDLIVSNAMLEEIYDVDGALQHMDRLLKPGGRLVHKIDFRDYGVFSDYGYHPLEFLTIPEIIYRRMAEATGQPNRRMIDYYRRKMEAMGYRFSLQPTLRLGDDPRLVEKIRPRLLRRYRNVPAKDLLIAGAYLCGQKQGAM